MAELSLNDYGRAANEAIARWKIEMEKSGKKLDSVCQEMMKLGQVKAPTAEEAKKLKDCTRLRDGLRAYILAESKKLDSTLRSFKLKKDTDLEAFGKFQEKVGTLLKDGVPISEHFSLSVEPPKPLKLLKLNETKFKLGGKF